MSNHEPDTSDLSWRDAFDLDAAQRRLTELTTKAGRSGDYQDATLLSNTIWWMDERMEEIAELSAALDECWKHLKEAQALLEKAP